VDIFIAVVLKDNQSSVVHVRWSFSRKSLCCTLLESKLDLSLIGI